MDQEAAIHDLQELISGVSEPISLVGALLASASVTVIARLTASTDSSAVTHVATGAFFASSCSFVTLVVYTCLLRLSPLLLRFDTDSTSLDFDFYFEVIQWTMSLGILSFLLGIGLLGWTKSRSLGITSTILAGCAAGLIIWEFLLLSLD